MTPLETTVRAEIRRRGRVTFAEFMSWALTSPRGGYYASEKTRTGRSGDFVTNVQVPLFAELLTEQLMEMWDALRSERLTLIELGAGDGVLAERVLRALEDRGRVRRVSLHLVEAGGPSRERARRRLSRFSHVAFHARLEDVEHVAGVEGCVYSNEFFDALPVHRVRWTEGAWAELYVEERGGVLGEHPGPLSSLELAARVMDLLPPGEEGQEAEVPLALDGVMETLARVLARGFVWTADYGGSSEELYDPHRRPRGTLRSFEGHRLAASPLENIGNRDITAHVNFSRLAAVGEKEGFRPLVFADQGPYLLKAGESLLRARMESASPGAPLGREIQQLIHPSAFGGAFRILIQSKNAADVRLRAESVGRLQRLGERFRRGDGF